jgi:putative Holliday junction resolvase
VSGKASPSSGRGFPPVRCASVISRQAGDFAKVLFEEFAVEVLMIDERLSTVSAQRKLKDAGISTRESKTLIDAMAAVAILEQGLASETR